MKPVLAIDAKASEHFLHGQGIGRLKHMDVAYLWIQDDVRQIEESGNLGHLKIPRALRRVVSKTEEFGKVGKSE